MSDYLILGCGYTASRVARSLVAAGVNVLCTNQQRVLIAGANCVALDILNERSLLALTRYFTEGMTVLYSIPVSPTIGTLLDRLQPFHPRRFVYLSTTGVYGATEFVDEETEPAPETERDRERLHTEQLIAAGPWSTLVLRPAAIYGPHRGIHFSVRTGLFRSAPDAHRIISRIHVDDLANQVLAGLRSTITGTFPVADEEPSTSLEMAEWTCAFLGIPLRLSEQENTARNQTSKGRRVDGSAYRQKLGLPLQYPSFRQGIPASLAAETAVSV